MKRWTVWLLCVLCCITAAAADADFWPSLDWTDTPMQLEVSAQAVTHMPFDDTRVAWLNGLLKHMKLTAWFRQLADEQYMDLALTVDSSEVLRISECADGQSSMVQTSLRPGVTYVTYGNVPAASLLLGTDDAGGEPQVLGMTLADLRWTADAELLMDTVRRDWPAGVSRKASKQSISGYGSVTHRLTLTVAGDEAKDFGPWLAENCVPGRLAELLRQLTFCGKQTLVWYVDGQDQVHQFTWTGQFEAEGIQRRKLSLTWNMLRTEASVKDSLAIKTPLNGEKNTEYNTVNWKRTQQKQKDGSVTDKESFNYTQRINKQKLTMSGTIDMKRADRDGLAVYTGSMQLKRTLPEADEEQADLAVNVTVDERDSSVLGEITLGSMVKEMNRESAVLKVDLRPSEPVKWNLQPQTVDLDQMTAEERTALAAAIADKAARTLIRPLVLLPREDTLFLSQDMSDEAWAAIVDAAGN